MSFTINQLAHATRLGGSYIYIYMMGPKSKPLVAIKRRQPTYLGYSSRKMDNFFYIYGLCLVLILQEQI